MALVHQVMLWGWAQGNQAPRADCSPSNRTAPLVSSTVAGMLKATALAEMPPQLRLAAFSNRRHHERATLIVRMQLGDSIRAQQIGGCGSLASDQQLHA